MSILDNEGHDPAGLGNAPSRSELNEARAEIARLTAEQDRATAAGVPLLAQIIDYFVASDEGPGDWWAPTDDGSSYALDHTSKDGTKFWIDLDKAGRITLLWKPAGQARPTVMKFAACEQNTAGGKNV